MSKAEFHKGIFTESSLVLAEGTFQDGVLQVTAFGFPPTEPWVFYSVKAFFTYFTSSGKTRQYFGTQNFFGGDRVTNVGSSERLQSLEIQSENSVCVLSDVRFDSISCVSKLNKLVEGFSGRVPKKEFS